MLILYLDSHVDYNSYKSCMHLLEIKYFTIIN